MLVLSLHVDNKDKVQPDEQTTNLRTDSVKEEIVTNEGEQDAVKSRLFKHFQGCSVITP